MSIALGKFPGCVFYDGGELSFSDTFHVYNHLNYLFRTDRAQKWTCEETDDDVAVLDQSSDTDRLTITSFGDADRQELHDAALNLIKKEFSTTNLAVTDAYRSLYMAVFYVVEQLPVLDVIALLHRAFEKSGLGHLLCAVIHNDQKEPTHVHLLFHGYGSKPRGSSRIAEVVALANEMSEGETCAHDDSSGELRSPQTEALLTDNQKGKQKGQSMNEHQSETNQANVGSRQKDGHGKRRVIVVTLILLIAAAGITAAVILSRPQSDPGATLMSVDDMSREEIQAMLDEQVRENMMDISVAASPELSGSSLRVNVVNSADNRFSQRFVVEQDGETLYESGIIAPGEGVETCEVTDAAHDGAATVTVYAVDTETGADHGNPTSVNVQIVSADN